MTRAELDGLPPIKVVGVGGGGCNAVNRMVASQMSGVEFVAINTDAQALLACGAETRMRIGEQITRGLGAGGDPDMGRAAAEESREELKDVAQGRRHGVHHRRHGRRHRHRRRRRSIAQIAKDLGALTVAVVTQALRLRGSEAPAAGGAGHRRARRRGRHADRHPERPPARDLRPEDVGAAGLHDGRRRAAPGHPGHLRGHHHAGRHQPRLRRRAADHVRGRPGADGDRQGGRREPRRRGRPGRDRQPAAGREHPRRARRPVQRRRAPARWACTS